MKMQSLQRFCLDVLDTPVSPELLPPKDGVISQKTEDLVGPYELHDFFLYYMLRLDISAEENLPSGTDMHLQENMMMRRS